MLALKIGKWIGWGLVIWTLGLFWPELYQGIIALAMGSLALALILLTLAGRHLNYSNQDTRPNKPEPKHASRPSRPVPPLSMA